MYDREFRDLLKAVGRSSRVMKSVAGQLREADLPHLAALLEATERDLSRFNCSDDTQPIDTSTL